jgi:hypothetical protein
MALLTRHQVPLAVDLRGTINLPLPAFTTQDLAETNLQVWYANDGTAGSVFQQDSFLKPNILTLWCRFTDPAREAYEEAVELFKRELTEEECRRVWLDDKNTMYDVQQAIEKARNEYEGRRKKSSMRAWLSRCAARIVFYGNILDVFIQGCPDYASFVWGAIKFLFIVGRLSCFPCKELVQFTLSGFRKS